MAEFLASSDPRSQAPERYRNMYIDFLIEFEYEQLAAVLLLSSSDGQQEHHGITVAFADLVYFNSPLAFYTINYPAMLLPVFDEALVEAQKSILDHSEFKRRHQQPHVSSLRAVLSNNTTGNSNSSASLPIVGSIKRHCHIRIHTLPPIPDFSKATINDVNSDNVSSLLQISGTVVRTGGVRMLDLSKQYECQNPKCKFRFTTCADPEQNHMLPQPKTCPRPSNTDVDANGRPSTGAAKGCTSTNFREVEGSRVCIDYQEIKLQDKIDRLSGVGSVPRSIVVILEADLVDKFNAGDDIVVVGIIQRQWRPVLRGGRCVIDLAIKANCVTMLHSSEKIKVACDDSEYLFKSFWEHYKAAPFTGRNLVVKSICPQLFGLYYVKLCLLLTLVGGTNRNQPAAAAPGDAGSSSKPLSKGHNAVRRRFQSHLLLIGDPGCGKSQILRFAAATTRRSVLTTGIGTTGAGLTCTIAKDGIDWVIEAGALVLANEGVCCIDEFASIREADRATIHEAMEQQTLSVAKAGLVVKLNTRASVIACCNPKGSYDVNMDISTNTAIASPLLSRFDLVLILLDSPNKEWDKQVSTFLLQQAVNKMPSIPQSYTAHSANGDVSDINDFNAATAVEFKRSQVKMNQDRSIGLLTGPWDLTLVSQYIAYVKHTSQPIMSHAAKALLMRYYQMQRQSDERSSARTTVRLLESLMRLSEAHAKIMCRCSVDLCDAVVAVFLVSLSQTQTSILDSSATLQSSFPTDSEMDYQHLETKVFSMLHIHKDRFVKEHALTVAVADDEIFTAIPSEAFQPLQADLFDRPMDENEEPDIRQNTTQLNESKELGHSDQQNVENRHIVDSTYPRYALAPTVVPILSSQQQSQFSSNSKERSAVHEHDHEQHLLSAVDNIWDDTTGGNSPTSHNTNNYKRARPNENGSNKFTTRAGPPSVGITLNSTLLPRRHLISSKAPVEEEDW